MLKLFKRRKKVCVSSAYRQYFITFNLETLTFFSLLGEVFSGDFGWE